MRFLRRFARGDDRLGRVYLGFLVYLVTPLFYIVPPEERRSARDHVPRRV